MPRPRSSSRKTPPYEPKRILLGDLLKIERRYVVDGILTCVTDKGRFKGVQAMGSIEHLVFEDRKTKEVRLFPLASISEITLLSRGPAVREEKAQPERPGWDPGFA